MHVAYEYKSAQVELYTLEQSKSTQVKPRALLTCATHVSLPQLDSRLRGMTATEANPGFVVVHLTLERKGKPIAQYGLWGGCCMGWV